MEVAHNRGFITIEALYHNKIELFFEKKVGSRKNKIYWKNIITQYKKQHITIKFYSKNEIPALKSKFTGSLTCSVTLFFLDLDCFYNLFLSV